VENGVDETQDYETSLGQENNGIDEANPYRSREDAAIIRDLAGVNMLGIDTSSSEILESFTVISLFSDFSHTVPVISGVTRQPLLNGFAFWDAFSIVMFYGLVQNADTLTLLGQSVANDLALYGDYAYLHPTQTSMDVHTVAMTAVNFIFPEEDEVVTYVYVKQHIPDSPYVLSMVLVLHEYLWESADTEVLEELGQLMGVDFMRFLTLEA